MLDNRCAVEFRRDLNLLDASVMVAGAIVGVGIFANPSNVARIVGEPILIVAAWIAGGVLALLGGFAHAELASRLPVVGGQYIYFARHPVPRPVPSPASRTEVDGIVTGPIIPLEFPSAASRPQPS